MSNAKRNQQRDSRSGRAQLESRNGMSTTRSKNRGAMPRADQKIFRSNYAQLRLDPVSEYIKNQEHQALMYKIMAEQSKALKSRAQNIRDIRESKDSQRTSPRDRVRPSPKEKKKKKKGDVELLGMAHRQSGQSLSTSGTNQARSHASATGAESGYQRSASAGAVVQQTRNKTLSAGPQKPFATLHKSLHLSLQTCSTSGQKMHVVRIRGAHQGRDVVANYEAENGKSFFDMASDYLDKKMQGVIGKKWWGFAKKLYRKTKPVHGMIASGLSAAAGVDPTGAQFMPQAVAQSPRQFIRFGPGPTEQDLMVQFCIPLFRVGYKGTGQAYASGWRGAMMFPDSDLVFPDWAGSSGMGTVASTSSDRCMVGVTASPSVQAFTWSENDNVMVKTVAQRTWLSPVLSIMGTLFNNYQVAGFRMHYAPQTNVDADGQLVFSFNPDPSHALMRLQEGDVE